VLIFYNSLIGESKPFIHIRLMLYNYGVKQNVTDNMEKFQTDSGIHCARYRYNLHVLGSTNLSKHQKGVYYSGIKLFDKLLPNIKSLML
jgi:hypothetical protein